MSRWHMSCLLLLVLLFGLGVLRNATAATAVLVSLAIGMFFLISGLRFFLALKSEGGTVRLPEELLPDHECPFYTVFAPVYKAAKVLPQLVGHLSRLDYPAEKLQIFMILEEDDTETRRVAEALSFPSFFHLVVVPDWVEGPRTKPRAMQYVAETEQLTGEYHVIYDAEDLPESDQLRKAATAFAMHPDIVGFQAELRWWNAFQKTRSGLPNLLTRGMAAGYALHFGLLLPGLAATGGVFPLGGTSNHIRMEALRRVGFWDIYNVTEDLDLGVKLCRAGGKFRMLPSVTREEATSSFRAQRDQVSRWIKGHPATFVAHTRNPWRLVRDLGWWKTITFLLVVGAPHPAVVVAPLFWGMTSFYALTGANVIQQITPAVAFYVGMLCFLANFVYVWGVMLAAQKTEQEELAVWLPLLPLYWATVLVVAAYAALAEIVRGEWYTWRLTQHVLIRQEASEQTVGQILIPQPVLGRERVPQHDGFGEFPGYSYVGGALHSQTERSQELTLHGAD